jgi:S-DNA-T family DNA segregation ATPase FtsK/SpoIIIE
VRSEHIAGGVDLAGEPWELPVGIGYRTLAPIGFRLHKGEHLSVIGPPRSGKSSLLVELAQAVRTGAPGARIIVMSGRPGSPLTSGAGVSAVAATASDLVAIAREQEALGPVVVFVDDAHAVPDAGGDLTAFMGATSRTHLVIAGRTDDLKGQFGHWTQAARKSGLGVVLKPQQPSDADYLGISLPYGRRFDARIGRGLVVMDGEYLVAQLAMATE